MQWDGRKSISSNPGKPSASLTSLARMGVDSGGTLTERNNDSTLALNTALERMSCVYSLGFNADGLRESRRLPIEVTVGRKHLRAVHPAYYVRRTEAKKTESRLLAAFVDPAGADDGSLRAHFIPRGGDGTTWKASLQVSLRPTGLPDNSAELGASIVRRDKVTDQFASSIATKSGSRFVVLENSVDVAPGEFSVVAVAHDVKRGDVGSSRLDAKWPDPAEGAVAIAPIAALQSGPAVFSKDGVLANAGLLARGVDEALDPTVAVSLESVVCRGAKTKGAIRVERWLEGDSRGQFAPMTIAEDGERCLPIVDVIPEGHLKPGAVDYRVAARIGDGIAVQERRTLRVGEKP